MVGQKVFTNSFDPNIILKKNYKTKNSETLDYIALKDIVFKEIEEYIST